MSEYDELWQFLNECHFNWECVADDVIVRSATDEVRARAVRIVFEVQDGDEDE
jgi:hypothetical protein